MKKGTTREIGEEGLDQIEGGEGLIRELAFTTKQVLVTTPPKWTVATGHCSSILLAR